MNAKTLERKRALALMEDCPQLSDRAIARQIGVGNKTVSRWRKEATPDQRLRGDELTTQELCALLAEHRPRIQQRRLRRWRQAGLLVPSYRRWSGQHSTYIWPRSAVQQGIEIDRLLRRYRNSTAVLIGLFALGYEVDERRLRAAYDRFLLRRAGQFQAVLEVLSHDDPEWDDLSEAVLYAFGHSRTYQDTRKLRPFMEHQLPLSEQYSPTHFVESTVGAAAMVFLRGRVGSDADMTEMLARAPSFAPPSTPPVPVERLIELSKRAHARMSFGTLARVAANTPLPELAASRDDAGAVAACLDAFLKPILHPTSIAERYPKGILTHWLNHDPLRLGVLTLVFHSIRQHAEFRPAIDDFIDVCREALPVIKAGADQVIREVYGETAVATTEQ
jgi:hypothetical protein